MTTTIDDIIARLEAATGPDRSLDGDIWRTSNGWPEADGYRFRGVWFRRDPEDDVAFEQPPAYTASIDAALALVPTGERLTYEQGPDGFSVRVGHPGEDWHGGATPAIAICIAALRARSAA